MQYVGVRREARRARATIFFSLAPHAHILAYSYGGSWQEGGARAASPPLQGLAPPARQPRAAGAPWEARAARGQTAGEDLVVVALRAVAGAAIATSMAASGTAPDVDPGCSSTCVG